MSKPRNNPNRELYGIIGSVPNASTVLKEWNAKFREQGMDASMDLYPTTVANLPERLSEMFHFDRRAYIVGKDLSKAIIPLLDEAEPAARHAGVSLVENHKGILFGIVNNLRSNSESNSATLPV